MKKRKWMLGSAMILALILVAGGTLAWFTATADPVVNEFTAGTLEIELIDEFDGAPNVNPGDCYEKIVYVENTGTKRAFVRIKKDIAFDNPNLGLGVVEYQLGDGWVEHDGYFYYTEALAAETGVTTNLFADRASTQRGIFGRWVLCDVCNQWYYKWHWQSGHCGCPGAPDPEDPEPPVDPPVDPPECNIFFNGEDMGNEYQGAVLEITIEAEAIQVTNGAALAEWGIDPTTLN